MFSLWGLLWLPESSTQFSQASVASLGKQFFMNSSVYECLRILISKPCYSFELPQIHDCMYAPYLYFLRPNTEGSNHGSKGPLSSCLLSQYLLDTFPLSLERYNESEENSRNWDFKTRSQGQASSVNDGFWEGENAQRMLRSCRDEKAHREEGAQRRRCTEEKAGLQDLPQALSSRGTDSR